MLLLTMNAYSQLNPQILEEGKVWLIQKKVRFKFLSNHRSIEYDFPLIMFYKFI